MKGELEAQRLEREITGTSGPKKNSGLKIRCHSLETKGRTEVNDV